MNKAVKFVVLLFIFSLVHSCPFFYERLSCLVLHDLCVIGLFINNSGIHTENEMFEEECRQINKNVKAGENARARQLSVRMILRGPWSLLKERQSDNSSMFSATALN